MSWSLISNIRGNTTKKTKASPLKEKEYCFTLQPIANHQGSKIPFRDLRWIGPYLVEKVLTINYFTLQNFNTNKTQIPPIVRLKKYNPQKPPYKNLYLKTNIRRLNGRLTIILSFQKLIYTQMHGKRNLVDTYLTFLSYIMILTQLILMKVTQRDQTLLLSHVSIFVIHAMIKIGKLAPLLTQLYYNLQIQNSMVKVRTLRPLLTYITKINPNKHPIQVRTLKLNVNLCHIHHWGRVITLQRLKSTTLLLRIVRKTNLVSLEAADTTYALIQILFTQKKNRFWRVQNFTSAPFLFSAFSRHLQTNK